MSKKKYDIELIMLVFAGIVTIILSLWVVVLVVDRVFPPTLTGLKVQFKITGEGEARMVAEGIRTMLLREGVQVVDAPTIGVRILEGVCYVGHRNPKLPRPSVMDVVFSVSGSGGHSIFVKISPTEAIRDGSGFRPLRDEMVYLLAEKVGKELRAQLVSSTVPQRISL